MVIAEGEGAPTRRGGATHAVDQDIEAPQTLEHGLQNLARPLECAQVGLDEPIRGAGGGDGSGGADDHRAPTGEPIYDCPADSLRAAGDQGALPRELVFLVCLLHGMPPESWIAFAPSSSLTRQRTDRDNTSPRSFS